MAGIERFASGGPWESRFGYSRAVRAGDLLLVSGTTAIDEDGVVGGVGDAGAQTGFAIDRIAAVLEEAGASLERVVLTRMYVTDISRVSTTRSRLAPASSSTAAILSIAKPV